MTPNNAYNQYKENSVYTASPEELTLMLYNGIIKFVMQAQLSICDNNYEKVNYSIIRAQDIIIGLQATLEMKYAVSHNLMLLYDYMSRRLVDANIKKDKEILDEVLGFARELRETWAQAMKISKQHQPRQAIAE